MSNYWSIWIAGTNEALLPDDNSEVDITDLPTALQTVDSPNWQEVKVYFGRPEKEKLTKNIEWNNAIINGKGNRRVISPSTINYSFPDEIAELEDIIDQFAYSNVLVCIDGAAESNKYPFRFHNNGQCLVTACNVYKVVEDAESGTKSLDFTLKAQIGQIPS